MASAGDWAQRAKDDAARYQRENPGWRAKDAKQPKREWSPAELERFATLASETREDFWARREAEGTTYGLRPCPPLRKAKRGPSKETLALKARIAQLEALLATARREREEQRVAGWHSGYAAGSAETRPLETRRVVASW